MKTMPSQKPTQPPNEAGIVAILVVIIFTALLALVALGFSHLMDREERQSLDRQLSLQSYYAAESGLNDSRTYLALANGAVTGNTDCGPPSDGSTAFVSGGDISGDGTVKYSCVVVNPKPNELIYNPSAGQSVTFKINLANLSKLYFSWQNQGPGTPAPLTPTLGLNPREDQLQPNATGELRVGIYPINSAASQGAADTNAVLNGDSRTYFMYPLAGSGNSPGKIDYVSGGTGKYVSGNCNANVHPSLPYSNSTPRYCNAEIDSLNSDTNTYYVRLTALYAPLFISIQAAQDTLAGPKSLPITSVEGTIDVTGQGNDVLNRISARIPLGDSFSYPSYGLQSMESVCKLFKVPIVSKGVYGQPESFDASYDTDGTCVVPFNAGAVVGGGPPPISLVPCGLNTDSNYTYPSCRCLPGYTASPPGPPFTACVLNPPPQCPSPPGSGPCNPSPPSINSFSYNGGNSFTYNVSNAASCYVTTDNPAGGQQVFSPTNGGDFGVTAGNGGSGWLTCSNGGGATGPVRAS